ncbi:syntaxin-1A-like [Diaphorina citri]|uniref:Syntaxin-1A-like n=2 Tax=Diaphorina citri TaxID=121845 RepID=A0A3Q0JDZ4_DIACI|nr:syntaxin-1A-like [Diaphorina citri]
MGVIHWYYHQRIKALRVSCVMDQCLQLTITYSEYHDCFMDTVEDSRALIANIQEHVKAMRNLHSDLLSSPRQDENMKLELDARTETVKKIAKKVSNSLKKLERSIKKEEDEIEDGHIPASLRIRKTQQSTTLHLLVEAITEFNQEQLDYKEKCEERIQRVVSIARAEISDEKLEELLEQGNYASIFNADIVTETLEARKALEDVQIRHQELLKLEKSIQELRDLFVEMALLVEQQGDIIDSIEHHVMEAGEAVETARVQTKKAIVYQKKARMKKLIFLACLGVFGLVLLIFIFSSLFSSKK